MRLEGRGFGIKPGLDRIDALVQLLDNPQLTYPTIHIAGTNGKSTTARMIGNILAAHGLKTGVYTSPHLSRVTERFALYGSHGTKVVHEEMTQEECRNTLDYLMPFVEVVEKDQDEQVTYFELTSLMAFEWMAEKTVAAGVYETGLGGTWDATNVLKSGVCVIAPIAVDHRDFLGNSPAENAVEKLGIIKGSAWTVSAAQEPEVERLLEETVRTKKGSLRLMERDFKITSDQSAVGGRLATIETKFAIYLDVFLPLFGKHQTRNLALAIAAAESFMDRELNRDQLDAALAVLKSPGRLEVLVKQPLVVLDGAHNPHAARALAQALPDTFGPLPITMVISIFEDKDAEGIIGPLVPLSRRMIFTRSTSPRAADPHALARLAGGLGAETQVVEDLGAALDGAVTSAASDEMVLVTGSLQAVGEARDHLEGNDSV